MDEAEALAELSAGLATADADLLRPHLVDWRGRKEGRALALLRPRSTAEVQECVRWALRHRIAIVPQGGNTGLVGGSVPEAAGRPAVVLSLRRMDGLGAVDPHGLVLVAGAGAILDSVHQAAEAANLRFPLSLGSRGSATIGGLVSTNAGGVQVLRHGPMRSQVLGLEAVLADGSRVDQLSPLRKDNTGYDVKQLLIGAEGTLGVITKVALRLSPPLAARSLAWVALPGVGPALALLARLRHALGERIESFELMTAAVIELLPQQIEGARIPLAARTPVHVLVEAEAEESRLESLLEEALAGGEIVDAALARSGAQSAAFWRLREEIAVAERSEGAAIKNDVAVPVDRLPAFHEQALALFGRLLPGARPLVFGHMGDGNLHWNIRPPKGVDSGPWVEAHDDEAHRAMHDLVTGLGGTISAEHGIGTLKRAELQRLCDPGKYAAMRAIKQALDPLDLFNPGKLFA